MVSRRQLIGLGVGAGVVAAATGCDRVAAHFRTRADKEAFAVPPSGGSDGARLFGRAGFGHRPGDLLAYTRDGHEATVERLLRADVEEERTLKAQISHLEVFRIDAVELPDWHGEELMRQLQQAAILRAVYGANPLKERMADFWTDHFNIFGKKDLGAFRAGYDQEEVIRPHSLGTFPDMLHASAKSPAMLGYLDNEKSQKGSPNENYARELMELHTLGVDGGYTQKDIQEVARCFTGWTVEDRFLHARGSFRFDADRHDTGEKLVLGQRIPAGGGEDDGLTVLKMLCEHPSTAKFLAKKMSRAFLGKRVPAVESRVAAAYLKTKGDIRAMMRALLMSDEFLTGPPILKRPLDLVASSLRALDATTDADTAIIDHLGAMGQVAYEWPMPDGFPVKTSAWSGSMLPRWNYAFALANKNIRGTYVEDRELTLEQQLEALFGRPLTLDDNELLLACRVDGLGVAMASPEFQWR